MQQRCDVLMSSTSLTRIKQKHTAQINMQRIFRVVESFDFSALIENCPVQLIEGYVISDIETHELFTSFTFCNVSGRLIKELHIRLFFYQNANIPYLKQSFCYSYDNFTFGIRTSKETRPFTLKSLFFKPEESSYIEDGESFGKAAYIKIPETYFKKIELEISSVVYYDSSEQEIKTTVKNNCTRILQLSDEDKRAIDALNIYIAAKETYPITVIPQLTSTAWLCCCGYKNLRNDTVCKQCLRDRDWQFESLTEDAIKKKAAELKQSTSSVCHDKTLYKQDKYMESEKEIEAKIKEYEKAIRNIAKDETRRAHNRRMIIPKIIIYLATCYGLAFLITMLADRLG